MKICEQVLNNFLFIVILYHAYESKFSNAQYLKIYEKYIKKKKKNSAKEEIC